LLIFPKSLQEYEPQVDEVLIVRGKVDHGDKGTSVIVQEIKPFTPSAKEVAAAKEQVAKIPVGPQPLQYTLDASKLPPSIIDDLKHVLQNFPGESELVLALETSRGPRVLRFGDAFRVKSTPTLKAELEHLLGRATIRKVPAPPVAVEPPAAAAAPVAVEPPAAVVQPVGEAPQDFSPAPVATEVAVAAATPADVADDGDPGPQEPAGAPGEDEYGSFPSQAAQHA
jgi:hypothetical protein